MKNRLLPLLPAFLYLNGCATMNEAECLNADWKIIGIEDGSEGRAPSYLGLHRSACATYNVTPDLEAYMQGHQIGVKHYCTPANGYNVGEAGKTYNGVCPPQLEANFLANYEHGYEHYKWQRELDNIDSSIQYNTGKINDLKKEISELENQIVSNGTTEALRASLLEKIKERQNKIGYLESEISDYNRNKIILNDRLQIHNQQFHY